MSEISEFSNETSSKIEYYVYRLVDPRNGQTFYVGKGKGNRVFQHVKGAIALYDGVDKKEIDEVNDPNKLRINLLLQCGDEKFRNHRAFFE